MVTCGSFIGKVGMHHSEHEPIWLTCVAVTRPFFAKERVTDFGIFDSEAKLALQKMQDRFDMGLPIDFQVSVSILPYPISIPCRAV